MLRQTNGAPGVQAYACHFDFPDCEQLVAAHHLLS
jgi:hypothetical protein